MERHYQLALQQALDWIIDHFTPTGIVVSGSILRGNPHPNSDFDLYVLHEQAFRQRVQKRFNGVPCEIFVNTAAHVQSYFASEQRANRPVTAHLLATGQLVHGHDNPQLLALLAEARHYLTQAAPLTEEQVTFRTYGLATLFEDATDTLGTDALTCHYLLDQVVAQVVDYAFVARQRPLPRLKDRLRSLAELDASLGLGVQQYYLAASLEEKYALAKELVFQVAGAVGFFEWASMPIS